MHYRKSKIARRWFESFLIVLLPCFVFCFLLCGYLFYILEENVMSTNMAMTNQVQKNVDSRLEELNRYMNNIEISSANTELKKLKEPVSEMPKSAYQLADTLYNYLAANKIVSNAYIFYPYSDIVIGNMGAFRSYAYYLLQGYPLDSGYEGWMEELSSIKKGTIKELAYQKEKRLCYVRPMMAENKMVAVIVMEIDKNELITTFETLTDADSIVIGIWGNEKVLTSSGDSVLLEQIPMFYENWDRNTKEVLKLKDHYGFLIHSAVADLTYVTVYAADEFLRNMKMPLLIFGLGTIICIIAGLIGTIYICIKNTKPIRHLMDTLCIENDMKEDEYQFVIRKFEQMTADKYKSDELMQRYQILLDEAFFISVLKQNIQEESAVFAEAKFYEVTFEAAVYQVLILHSIQKNVPEHAPVINELRNIVNEFDCTCLIAAVNGQIVILLSTDDPVEEEKLSEMISRMQVCAFSDSASQAIVGKCFDNISELTAAYQSAVIALKTIPISEGQVIEFYSPSMEKCSHGNEEIMKEFTNMVYSGQFYQAKQFMDQLYSVYIYSADVRVRELRKNAVTSLLVDVAHMVLSGKKADKAVWEIMTCTGSDEKYLDQTRKLLELMQNVSEQQSDDKRSIAEQAKMFIDNNFADPMMGLYLVSEKLGVSNTYLSAAFKKAYDINTIQYINRLRIDKAKKLILNTKKNIKEIAGKVGFASDIHFIRVFKKLENQTPSMLRKQDAGKKQDFSDE